MMRRVFLGLGSNLGDRWAYLRDALESLPDVVAISAVYETEPVDALGEQGPYLNAVVQLMTELSNDEILDAARWAESQANRTRTGHNGPRTLDVDVLLIGEDKIKTDDLEVPHPRMWARRFVLEPLSELAPELLPEGWESNVTGKVWFAGTL
jgi:2-amino-4-hydroxy-6-hydroxymethyldihydropteridine diphosphokinase